MSGTGNNVGITKQSLGSSKAVLSETATFLRAYIFVMAPKWNVAVTKLVIRKEQKSHPMRYIFGISALRRPNIPNFGKS